jgi:hypothetical protein
MLDDTDKQKPSRKRSRDAKDDKTEGPIRALVSRMAAESKRRVGLREPIEQRWLQDLRQFHGQHEPSTVTAMSKDAERSRLFMNHTRPKTNAMSARLQDLLFPTDDRNWGIQPTPVPELLMKADRAKKQIAGPMGRLASAEETGTNPDATDEELELAGQQATAARDELEPIAAALEEIEAINGDAKQRADLMQDEMADQLQACSYNAVARDAIEQGCKLGTGVIKGPILGNSRRRRWKQNEAGERVLENSANERPSYKFLDVWGYFPDPDYQNPSDGEGVYERHLLSSTKLRELARDEGVDEDAIRRLLKQEPQEPMPNNVQQLHQITSDQNVRPVPRYIVWEYTGPIALHELEEVALGYADSDLLNDAEEMDILDEVQARIMFCGEEILSFSLHPLDSSEQLYSVFNLEKDEAGPFGFGIPAIMRDPQSAMNAAWRMMMDNGRIASGPQIVINTDVIKPQDNEFVLAPFKIWKRTTGAPNSPAFETYQFDMNQGLLQSIIELARRDIDDTTAMPQITQGEQGTGVTKTAQGMAILMNSANVVFRRIVKNWDDDVTVPNIRRLYDHNMQFSQKDEIKGDFDIDARGSSVLLVREMLSSNLMLFAQTFGDHPDYGPWIKKPDLLKQITKAMMIPVSDVIHTKTEHDDNMAKMQQEQGDGVDPMIAIREKELELTQAGIDAKVSIAQMESSSRVKVAQLNFDGDMQRAAMSANEGVDDRAQRAAEAKAKVDSGERKLAAEVGMIERTGEHAGGSV